VVATGGSSEEGAGSLGGSRAKKKLESTRATDLLVIDWRQERAERDKMKGSALGFFITERQGNRQIY